MFQFNRIVGVAVLFAIAFTAAPTTALAQASAPVEWKVSDGGNGHWYQVQPKVADWFSCRVAAISQGADLACLSSATESEYVAIIIPYPTTTWNRGFMGGFQDPNSEPTSGWHWVDGSPWGFTNWDSEHQPDGGEGFLSIYRNNGVVVWGDYGSSNSDIYWMLLEWSTDCNSDGIVDYGQILRGELNDDNNNGVPDICEVGLRVPEQFASIQAAVNAAVSGDIIKVAPGTYTESISMQGKRVVITPSNPSIGFDLRAPQGQRSVRCENGEGNGCILRGIQFLGVPGESLKGGGASIANSSPRFIGCTFTGIRSGVSEGQWGGAVDVASGAPTFDQCTFTNCKIISNSSADGGALAVRGGSVTLSTCAFSNNAFSGDGLGQGGDLFLVGVNGTSATLNECTFTGSSGGGFGARIYNYGAGNDAVHLYLNQCVFSGITQKVISLIHGWDAIDMVGVRFENCSLQTNFGAYCTLVTQSRSRLNISNAEFTNCLTDHLLVADSTNGGNAFVSNSKFCNNSPSVPSWGAIIVDGGGNVGCPNVISVPSQFATIQAAIDYATTGKSIEVAPGTYNEAIDFKGKAITVKATGARANTIIDGTGLTTSVVRAVTGETSATVLQGFTIRNGPIGSASGTYRLGGGIFISSASPTIRDCAFTANQSAYGGGMYALYSNSLVENCTFSQNSGSADGGGMQLFGGSPIVRNCVVSDNTAGNRGGGFHVVQHNTGAAQMDGCTISGNRSNVSDGGGISMAPLAGAAQKFLVSNCTITNNSAQERGGGLWALVNPANPQQNVTLTDNTICNNISAISKRENVWALFEDGGNTICDCFADVTGDGDVDSGDFSFVLLFFGEPTDPDFIQLDQDMNGFIDTADLSLLLLNYGTCP